MFYKSAAVLVFFAASVFFSSCATTSLPAPQEKSESRKQAQSLVTGEDKTPPSPAPASAAPGAVPAASSDEAAVPSGLSPNETQYLDGYLKRLKYMMVLKEGTVLDEFQTKSVITKGNEYLLRQGFDVVSYDQLLKNMEDQRSAFEAEVGQSMTLTQYIAQKLGADVYVELDVLPRAWSEGGRHYGEAAFTANMFDPSTAELLASVPYKSDRSFSNTSDQDALLNALVAGTAQFMPRIARDSTAVIRNRYANGIRYQVIVQKTPDARVVSVFRRNLRSRVREIQSGSSAADQTLMDVYLFGPLSDLEDACYAAFEKTPGMENAYTVYTRGKSITFNSGN